MSSEFRGIAFNNRVPECDRVQTGTLSTTLYDHSQRSTSNTRCDQKFKKFPLRVRSEHKDKRCVTTMFEVLPIFPLTREREYI